MKKRTMALITAAVLALAMALTACGAGDALSSGIETETESAEEKVIDVDSLKTFGDIMEQIPEEQLRGQSISEAHIVYAFENGGVIYRAIGNPTDELLNAVFSPGESPEAREEEAQKLLKSIAIDKLENLSEQILSEDECKAFVGKTKDELLKAGWKMTGNFNLADVIIYMDYGPFSYEVTFEGESELLKQIQKDSTLMEAPDFDVEEVIKTMTVKSIANPELSDSSYDEID